MKKKMAYLAILSLMVLLLLLGWSQDKKGPDNFILSGGTILTMEPSQPKADAVWVKDGIIKAVGTLAHVNQLAGEGADHIDLKGNVLMPGFIEPHTHPVSAAMLSQALDISGMAFNSREALMSFLVNEISGFQPAPWIVAYGWDPLMIDDLRAPTLAELDMLSPDKPLILLSQNMHEAFVNSAALKAAGIDHDTPNPAHGRFERDADGKLNGMIFEVDAIARIASAIPTLPKAYAAHLLRQQYDRYARAGYTTIGVLGIVGRVEEPLELLKQISTAIDMGLRTRVWLSAKDHDENDIKVTSPNKRFSIAGVKYWMDGSPFIGGAAFAEPYANTDITKHVMRLDHGHSVLPAYDPVVFKKVFLKHHKAGRNIAVHVQGERAVDVVLSAAEHAQKIAPNANLIHRLEHNALITKEQLERAKKLGLEISFFVDHIYLYGHQLEHIVGPNRARRYMPLQTAINAGHDISLHGDHPMTSENPLRSVEVAITRFPLRGDRVIVGSEAVSLDDGLKAITINAAKHLGMDAYVGSISVGKFADLVLLDKNPYEVVPQDIDNIKALQTWSDGRRIDTRAWRYSNIKSQLKAFFDLISG